MAEHQHNSAILLCHDAEGAYWQFGRLPPRRGKFVLIGWTVLDSDEGVPGPVANALARGLAAFGRVTFLSSTAPRTETPVGWPRGWISSRPVRCAPVAAGAVSCRGGGVPRTWSCFPPFAKKRFVECSKTLCIRGGYKGSSHCFLVLLLHLPVSQLIAGCFRT